VLTEFFNELAYNPGPNKAGFLFFLDWGNHDLNSVVSSSDANGPVGRSLIYLNCEILRILVGVQEVNPTVNVLIGLLRPPTKAECESHGIHATAAIASVHHTQGTAGGTSGSVFSGLTPSALGAGGTSGGGQGGKR
jgi:hypothetical protein